MGISDVALGKACKKLRIPVPGRGYWARVASGQQIAKPRLPTLRPGEIGTYPVFRWVEGTPEEASGTDLEQGSAKAPAEKIPVPSVLHRLHPLLEKHLINLGQMEGRFSDFLKQHTCIAVWVSQDSLGRAMRIMTALLYALEERGGRIEVTKHQPSDYGLYHAKPSQTGVWFGEFFVPFCLVEGTDLVTVPPSPSPSPSPRTPSKWPSRHDGDSQLPLKVRKPNGQFTLQLTGYQWGHPANWTDGKRAKLEDRLHEFVRAVQDSAERARLRSVEEERQRIKAVEEKKQRDEEERLRRIEQARRFDLWSRIEDFTLSIRGKAYLQAVEAWARSEGLDLQPASEMGQWLAWAEDCICQQERDAVETILEVQRRQKAVHPKSPLGNEHERERPWGYWARTYKGW